MGGNPPIKNHTIVNKIVSSRKIGRLVIFTVFRDNWQPYMKKHTEVFQSQFPNLNTDYLLLDSEQVDFDSYLDHQIKIKNGLGIFSQFLISVHYDSWNDKANKDRAEKLVDVPIIPLNDHSCLVLDKLGNIIEKID